MELEREHTDNNAANSASEPAPVSSSPQEAVQSSTLEVHSSEPWHKIWNPLKLSETASSDFNAAFGKYCCFNSNFIYSLYFFVCTYKYVMFSALPLFVYFGNPMTDKNQSPAFFWSVASLLIVGTIALWAVQYLEFQQHRVHATFFKIVLLSEQTKESRSLKGIFLFMQIGYVTMLLLVRIASASNLKNCLEAQNKSGVTYLKCDDHVENPCDCWLPPADAPSLWSLNFFVISISYVVLCYHVMTYDDCFADHMLPNPKFMESHYPDEFDKSRKLYPNFGEKPMLYEPNIPIRPVYSCCTWFFTDSRDNLRNILLVCDRVVVLWQLHHSQLCQIDREIQDWKIKDFRLNADVKKCIDPKLLDESLKWEYVLLHCPLFHIILIFL
jgi:hypothetical protein